MISTATNLEVIPPVPCDDFSSATSSAKAEIFVTSLIVYCYLGYKQTVSPYKQAFLVAAVYWFIDLSVGALLYILLEISMDPLIYLISALLHVIAVLLGTLLGIQLRRKRVERK